MEEKRTKDNVKEIGIQQNPNTPPSFQKRTCNVLGDPQ